MNDVNMHEIIRISSNALMINGVVIVRCSDKVYRTQDKEEVLSRSEWDAIFNYLVSEQRVLINAANKAVNDLLDEMGIPRAEPN